MTITAGGQAAGGALRRKARAVLAYLAATGSPHHRRVLADLFCAETDAPTRALRHLLSRIRQQLGAQVIITDGDTVQINRPAAWIDSLEWAPILEGHLAGRPLAVLSAAVDLYRGDFLNDLELPDAPEFELWLLGQRARMRHLYECGLTEIIGRLMGQGVYEEAIRRAHQLVQSNPLLEEAHAHLIWLYAQIGQREVALAQYERCRELLRRELAVEPMPELRALYDEVAAGRVGRAFQRRLAVAGTVETWRSAAGFMGREAEMAQLQQAWQMAQSGQAVVVLVEAEAGGGKSRLVHEFGRQLAEGCFLAGRCYESTTALPYHPWIELLETHLLRLDDSRLKPLSPFARDYLTRLLPGLARRLGRSPPPATSAATGELEYIFAAVSEFLFQMPGQGGADALLTIFVDDLQWADETTLRLFHYIAHRARPGGFLLIGAFRSEEIEEAPALQTLLHDLPRDTLRHLPLAALTPVAIGILTAELWPKLPEEARPQVNTLLLQATGGNPLFVTEVLREMADAVELPAEAPIPATVRDLLSRRLRRLPERSQQVIEAMAVLHGPATIAEVQQVSARSEEETADSIDLGLRRGLLQAHTALNLARYDFKHDLIRQAVMGQLSHARQRLLHRRAATTLAQTAMHLPLAARQAIAGRIMRHALAGERFEIVFQWAPLAAAHATGLYAYADALSALEAACMAFEQMQYEPGFDQAAAEPQYIEILLNRAWLIPDVGRPPAEHEKVMTLAGEWLARRPQERLQALYYLNQSGYLSALGSYEQAAEAALKASDYYRRLGDQRGAAQGLTEAGRYKTTLGQNRAARRLLEQALALHRASEDTAGESMCLSGLAWAALNLGEVEVALEHLNYALAMNEKQADKPRKARTCYVLAAAWNNYYDAEKVRALAEESARLYREMGYASTAYRPLLYIGVAYRLTGDMAQAKIAIEHVFTEARAQRDTWLEGWAAQILGRVALEQGELAAAGRWLEHAYQARQERGELPNQISDLTWLGRLKLAEEQPEAALAYTTRAVKQLEPLLGEVHVFEMPDVFFCHAETLTAVGEHGGAALYVRRAYETLGQFAGQIADPQVKEKFLLYHLNARILSAGRDGRIPP